MPTTAVEFRDSSIFGKTTVFQAVSPLVGSIVRIACDTIKRMSLALFTVAKLIYTHRTESMLASKKVIVADSFISFHSFSQVITF